MNQIIESEIKNLDPDENFSDWKKSVIGEGITAIATAFENCGYYHKNFHNLREEISEN